MSTQEMQLVRTEAQLATRDFMPAFSIELAIERRNAMVEFTKKIMVKDTDFGTIPGTNKPSLYKAGAEKLITFFGLSPQFTAVNVVEDWTGREHNGEAFFYSLYKCSLLKNGKLIGEGEGSCNSWESKYRWRWVTEENVPAGMDKSKLQSKSGTQTEMTFAIDKAETGGKYGKPTEYWDRFKAAIANKTAVRTKKKIADGREFDAWQIGSALYRIPNPDIADIVNTVQKMAQKRALVAAVLVGVNASEFFTQDVEDMQYIDVEPERAAADDATETTEQVAARRIAEEKAKAQPKPAAAPPAAAQPKPAANSEVPAPVQTMWARMTNITSGLAVFEELKRDLKQLTGDETGDTMYYDFLAHAGVKKSNEFKSMAEMRKCARSLFEAVQQIRAAQALKAPGATSQEITDDDVPAGLFGQKEPAFYGVD